MKQAFLVSLLFCAISDIPAAAQDIVAHRAGSVFVSPLNCDLLKGDSRVCLENISDFDLTNISCEGWFDHRMQVPGGSIPGGGIAIVDFGKGACKKNIIFKWENGETKSVGGEDIYSLTTFKVKGPRKDAK
jgi:hypothetical protein